MAEMEPLARPALARMALARMALARLATLTLIPLLGAACASTPPPAAVPQETLPATPITIAPDLIAHPIPGLTAYVIENTTPISANALLYLTPDGTPILADTPWTPAATTTLINWTRHRFGRPPALAIISHFHLDAAGGIAALRAAHIPVVASTHTARLIHDRAPAMQAQLARDHGPAFEGWTVPPPDRTFDPAAGYHQTLGGAEIHVIFPAPAHAPDNVVTWIPTAGLLFGGCLVKEGDSLGYLGDADLNRYPIAVEALRELNPRVLIPGHGRSIDPALLNNTARLLAEHPHDSAPTPR
jgi:glyoxylase-like metal-dependent hydrolase (beta-lactamase superfamily II)